MQRLSFLLLTIFTICSIPGYSQRENLPVVNFTSRDYGKQFNPEIYCTIQDRRGIMYFGSGNGVHEYDGTRWNYLKVQAGSYVRSLGVDSSGIVYAGTNGDFGYFKPNKFGQLEFTSLLDKVPIEDQFFSDIWAIHCSKSKVYFQAQEVFFEYNIADERIVAVYPTETSSFHTSFLINGVLHLRAREIGIVKYENNDLVRLHGTEMVRGLGVFGLHQLDDDSLLIVTQEIGLWKWKNDVAVQMPEQNEQTMADLGIFGSKRLSDGNFMIWTFNSGAYVMTPAGKIIKHMDRQSGLQSNDIKQVFEDKDKNVWLSMGNGVALVNYYSAFSFYGEKSGLSGNIVAISRFKGELYVGTSSGLFVASRYGESLFENTDLVREQVWDFCVVDDRLYIATSEGVYSTSDGKAISRHTSYGTDANAIKFIEDKGVFVVAGPKGIYVYNRSFQQIYHKDENLTYVLGIEQDPLNKKLVWLGTVGDGAYRMTIEPDSIWVDQYTDFDGLLDNIGKPLIYHDTLIFGCKEGLSYFLTEEQMKKGLSAEELEDPLNYRGMFNTQDFHHFTTDNQFLYLKTTEEKDWFSDDNYSIGYYDHKENEFIRRPFKGVDVGRINRFYLEDNGTLWVGGSDGLVGTTNREKSNYQQPFYTLIRKFSIGSSDSVLFNGSFSKDGQLEVSQTADYIVDIAYSFNDVHFVYSAPYFEYQEALEYSYFLEAYDKEWTSWTKRTEATFTNLDEGSYNFMVKARNVYGIESEVSTFQFTILPPWYRTTLAFISYGIALIVIFFVGFRLFSLRLKRRNQWLEGVVEERTREISEKNEVLRHQKQEIEDSINYAQRIQEAILPLETEMKHWLPQSFVLFRPKDIVSGDFYWFTEREGKLVFICADCTGHGVPGAFMSMIGSDRLNIIVGERKILNPGSILSELNIAIKKSLKQGSQPGSTKDGMDAAICTIDLETKELMFAGANRPLWVVKDGEIEEVKPTKVAVAGFTPDDQVFEEHVIKLEPNMKFYMTSDGYADQFGGDKGKKLKVKTMKKFILDVCKMDFQVQKDELEKSLMEWMEGYEQIDDVCVVGFEPIH